LLYWAINQLSPAQLFATSQKKNPPKRLLKFNWQVMFFGNKNKIGNFFCYLAEKALMPWFVKSVVLLTLMAFHLGVAMARTRGGFNCTSAHAHFQN